MVNEPVVVKTIGQPELQDTRSKIREIVRYATLAPSSHNTQCWKFRACRDPQQENVHTITVLPDMSRRCSVVDPDDHHLYMTLGCAIENLIVAAKAQGFDAKVRDVSSEHPASEGVMVRLTPGSSEATPLFEAIPKRQCTRSEYDGKLLDSNEIKLLQLAGTGKGVQVQLLTDETSIETVLEFAVLANSAQISNSSFLQELKKWVRFDGRDATVKKDGLYGKCMGHPSIPRILGSPLFGFLVNEKSENEKLTKQVRSSAGIAIFVSDNDDAAHWIEAGRCYERFALQATALGIRNAMLNMPVEEADIRIEFAKAIKLQPAQRPDLVVRFGKGPEMPRSLRRPLEDVLEFEGEGDEESG